MILATSKTRAEVEVWRERLENRHPFIVENGGALYIPESYFTFPLPATSRRQGYIVIELGDPYEKLVQALLRRTGRPVAGRCRLYSISGMR